MSSIRFSITPEAIRFIDRVLGVNPSNMELVVVIVPATDPVRWDLKDGVLTNADLESIIKKIEADLRLVALRKLRFRWVVGASLRSRFPPEDIFLYDGVSCFIPEEMRAILDGCTLTLIEGELRLDPEPPVPNW